MVQALVLLSTLLLCLLIILSGWLLVFCFPLLNTAGPSPLWSIVSRSLEIWMSAGLILSTNLWIALRWPAFTVPLGAGIAGTFFAIFASSAKAAEYYPWLLPVNVLSDAHHLRSALIVGIGGGILVAILGCVDFISREESAPPNLSRGATAVWASVLVTFLALAFYLDRGLLWNSTTAQTVRFVTVDKNVRLEVLDWGGSGRPLVLLAGLGDTAHVFDRFAPKLAHDYHVYGITRRGFGLSSLPADGYSADRLGDDVLAVIDTLKLDRPVLVGHSIGGEELSSVGSLHPEKIAGLVYLDAAYPYAYYDPSRGYYNIDFFELYDKLNRLRPGTGLRDPKPLMKEVASSLPGFERVLKQQLEEMNGPPTTAAAPSVGGRVPKPGLIAARAIAAGEQKYTAIHVPVLAIFALPHDEGTGNPPDSEAEARDINEITGPQAKAFQAGMPSAKVVRLPHASHYVFQSNEADVIREMNAFIRTLSSR
jgi:pimeloyl-ACP methyl ester carboxylesterase